MTQEEIAEIGTDAGGSLFVRPRSQTFPFIYRSAMGVHWDEARAVLFGQTPREWSQARGFEQIVEAVKSEYGISLVLCDSTVWSISLPVRREIESGEYRQGTER